MQKLAFAALLVLAASIASAEHLNYTSIRNTVKHDTDLSPARDSTGPPFGLVISNVDPTSPAEHLGILPSPPICIANLPPPTTRLPP